MLKKQLLVNRFSFFFSFETIESYAFDLITVLHDFYSKQAYVISISIRLFCIARAHISSRTYCVISVVRVVKRSILGLDILIDKGEIHTEESNFKRHKVSADRYFHLPNLVGQKDFYLPKRNFHLPNGSLVGAFCHPDIP